MTERNVYNEADFLAGYLNLPRQVHGLSGAAEWAALRDLLPEIAGRRVVDLGCGLGRFSQWAAGQGAASVLGIDGSVEMLDRAEAEANSPKIVFRLADLNSLDLDLNSLHVDGQPTDIVFSSLALHYVRDLDRLLSIVAAALAPGGSLIFSVEHPIYSAPTTQGFVEVPRGDRVWPLNNYLIEGERLTDWFVEGVRKQHRTLATYMNSVIDAGFRLERLVEWGPHADQIEAGVGSIDDLHRPWFLLVKASLAAD